MDKNLQQFRKQDIFNPWKPWGIGAFGIFVLALVGLWIMQESTPSWYSTVLIFSGAICAITFFGSILDDEWVKVPKNLTNESGYWHVTTAGFAAAESRSWYGREKDELIYLFDGMPITISYLDEVGAERQLHFLVRFKYAGGPLYARYLCFYKWYREIPKTIAAIEYVMYPASPFFSIEQLITAPAMPAMNA